MIERNWQELIRPEKPQIEASSDPQRKSRLVAEPLERGFGVTLGNALRRVLLSSLQGAAVTAIQIDGVVHEFSSLEGVREDVVDIVLNIKQLALRMHAEGPKRMTLRATGPGAVTAGQIDVPSDIEVLNPDHVICTLDEGASVRMELTVQNGKGYVASELNRPEDAPIGLIAVDALYSPVKRVAETWAIMAVKAEVARAVVVKAAVTVRVVAVEAVAVVRQSSANQWSASQGGDAHREGRQRTRRKRECRRHGNLREHAQSGRNPRQHRGGPAERRHSMPGMPPPPTPLPATAPSWSARTRDQHTGGSSPKTRDHRRRRAASGPVLAQANRRCLCSSASAAQPTGAGSSSAQPSERSSARAARARPQTSSPWTRSEATVRGPERRARAPRASATAHGHYLELFPI